MILPVFLHYESAGSRAGSPDCFSTSRLMLYCFVCFLLVFFGSEKVHGAETAAGKKHAVRLHFFWGKGCPHCEEEKQFLQALGNKYPTLQIRAYEVWHNAGNAELLARIMKGSGAQASGVPVTVVGNKLFIGFSDWTSKGIEKAVGLCMQETCPDALERLSGGGIMSRQEEDKKVSLPLVGEIDPARVSLPLFTVVIGGLDSFNPCAFFVLLFLLSMMIHARSRKKMLLIGGIFVFFSGFIYFLFMAAWLNVFLVIGRLTLITVAAAVVALLVALINIKDFFFFKKGVSLVIPDAAKPKLFERMRRLLKSSSPPALIGGTIVLAVSANAYELLCTAGFPMVYTRALTLHNLTTGQYYLYLVLYNFVYVVPLATIVLVITVSLGARKLTEWQGRQLKLVSGLMMFFLGLILLLDPALLNNAIASAGLLAVVVVASSVLILITKKLKPEIAIG
jgi:hypothetical protein